MLDHTPTSRSDRNILKAISSPVPCGIGMYEKYIPDNTWIANGTRVMRQEVKPVLFMKFVEENILEAFGQAGYAESLPAILAAKQALSAEPLTDDAIYFALTDLLVGLRQALSQAHL